MGPRLSRTSDAPRKQRKEANITRASSIAACKAAGLTVFAKREERFGFSQANADEISDQIPDRSNMQGPYVFNLIFSVCGRMESLRSRTP